METFRASAKTPASSPEILAGLPKRPRGVDRLGHEMTLVFIQKGHTPGVVLTEVLQAGENHLAFRVNEQDIECIGMAFQSPGRDRASYSRRSATSGSTRIARWAGR